MKRRAAKQKSCRIPAGHRANVERLVELLEAHADAVRGGDQTFYFDGRHHELIQLGSQIRLMMGIKPWEDSEAILRSALREVIE